MKRLNCTPYSAFTLAAALAFIPVAAYAQTTAMPDLRAEAKPLDLAALAGVTYADSTSSTSSSVANAADLLPNAPGEMQPPPRRRYGRPRYNDNMHNPDGSSKYAFIAGAGATAPVLNSTSYLNTSYKFQVGAGRNFNQSFAVLLQFDYDKFGLPNLATQRAYYNSFGFIQQNQDGSYSSVDFSQLDGNAHIWSFTLNPTYNFHQGDKYGFYGVVGGGFYHKVTNFTLPATGVVYDPYYGPYYATFNQNIDHYTSNSAGANGGIGITLKPSRFASQRFYAEARFVHTFDHYSTKTAAQGNYYPQNSRSTNYIPMTVGIRF